MTDPLVDNRNRQPSQKGYICDNRRLPRECQDNPPLRLFRDHPNNQLPNNYILWTASLLAWTILSRYCCSVAKSCPTLATPWTRLPYPSLSPWVCWNSCLLTQYLILCHPFLLLPSIFLSIRVFSNELALHSKCPKYWSFNFSISLSNDYLGLISFRIDWFDLLAVQGTLKSLLQCHSSEASIVQHSAIFMVQLSHLYMTTGKTITVTLLFSTLSRFVITLLPRSKCLLIS